MKAIEPIFKKQLLKLILAFIFGVGLLTNCATKKITVDKFNGFYEIKEGEQAIIEWNFKYADRVYVNGIDQVFEPIDKIYLKPKESQKYSIIAYQGNVDSLLLTAWVEVKKQFQPEPIKRGPTSITEKPIEISSNQSNYFKGLSNIENTTPTSLRIIKTSKKETSDNNFKVQAILIDNNGNFVSGYSPKSKPINIVYENKCEDIIFKNDISQFKEVDCFKTKSLDIAISIDNSASASENPISVEYIKEFVKNLSPRDYLSLSFYNHKFDMAISLMSMEKALWELENIHIDKPSGLNAIYKSAYKSIQELNTGYSDIKVLILIAYNVDNSSLIFTANDVADIALKSNIAVYTIGVGDAINSNSLKYLSSITGGRYYHISEDNLTEITNILTEIALSQRVNYEFELTTYKFPDNCKSIASNITFEIEDYFYKDKINLITQKIEQYSQYQAVATFNFKEAILSDDYSETLESLARVLKDNPNTNIELIGCSENEGNKQFNSVISTERAKAVKDALNQLGVGYDRISVKGIGRIKPIYYIEQFEWQKSYNRRVELRWLDPILLPFEIIVEQVKTEDEAIRKVETWERRGYRTYYERYLYDLNPYYRVKIWGYPTLLDAKTEVEVLKKKYNMNFYID